MAIRPPPHKEGMVNGFSQKAALALRARKLARGTLVCGIGTSTLRCTTSVRTDVASPRRAFETTNRFGQEELRQVQDHAGKQHGEANCQEEHHVDWQGSKHCPGKGDANEFRCHQQRETVGRSEEHTSELQSLRHFVCRLLLEKKKKTTTPKPSSPAPQRTSGWTAAKNLSGTGLHM